MDQTTTEQVYIYNTCPAKATKPLYLFIFKLYYYTFKRTSTLKKEKEKREEATTLKINKTLNKNSNYF